MPIDSTHLECYTGHRFKGEPRATALTEEGLATKLLQHPALTAQLPQREDIPMKYDLRRIMTRAWELFRKLGISFSEALHRSWVSEKSKPENSARIERAKAAANVSEECRTWSGWRELGWTVKHGSKALFQCELIHASKGDNAIYRASFFGKSQVELATA